MFCYRAGTRKGSNQKSHAQCSLIQVNIKHVGLVSHVHVHFYDVLKRIQELECL